MIGTVSKVLNIINNKNFDDDNLVKSTYMRVAELKHVRPVLGETLYDDIDTNASGTGYSTLKSLYLDDVIAYYTVYESLPFIQLQITDKGLMVNTSETSNQATSEQRAELRNSILSQANVLRDRMMEYIKDNVTTYTLYDSGENQNLTTTVIGGIILDT